MTIAEQRGLTEKQLARIIQSVQNEFLYSKEIIICENFAHTCITFEVRYCKNRDIHAVNYLVSVYKTQQEGTKKLVKCQNVVFYFKYSICN